MITLIRITVYKCGSDNHSLEDITPRRQNEDEKLKSIQLVAIIHPRIVVKFKQVSHLVSEFERVKSDEKSR